MSTMIAVLNCALPILQINYMSTVTYFVHSYRQEKPKYAELKLLWKTSYFAFCWEFLN